MRAAHNKAAWLIADTNAIEILADTHDAEEEWPIATAFAADTCATRSPLAPICEVDSNL